MAKSKNGDLDISERMANLTLAMSNFPAKLLKRGNSDWIDQTSGATADLVKSTAEGQFALIPVDNLSRGNSPKQTFPIPRSVRHLEGMGRKTQLSLFGGTSLSKLTDPHRLSFTFVDLFAGIGGMRLGLEAAGGTCLFSCEWDEHCQRTYQAWFGDRPAGDIRRIALEQIPDHDILAAGFPCQPFSIAGVSKKKSLGRAHGFRDKSQGNLFFRLATIIEVKRPAVLMLENVKNLQSHNQGQTWQVIRNTLEKLNYRLFSKVIDAAHWVPQHRERMFIIGFHRSTFGEAPPFRFPEPPTEGWPRFRDILEEKVDPKYTLTHRLWSYLRQYAERHRSRGNGFGFGLADFDRVSRTLSARYYKDGSEILIPQGTGRNPRRLTPREAARLMGFSDDLPIVVSDTQAYRQFGNAVVPPVAGAVARQVAEALLWKMNRNGAGCHFSQAGEGERLGG